MVFAALPPTCFYNIIQQCELKLLFDGEDSESAEHHEVNVTYISEVVLQPLLPVDLSIGPHPITALIDHTLNEFIIRFVQLVRLLELDLERLILGSQLFDYLILIFYHQY